MLAVAPVAASAAEEPEWAIEPAAISAGDPGNLIIDASVGGNVEIQLPAETPSFETREDFAKYMVDTYNAELVYDDQGAPDWYTLEQTVLGEPVYFDGTDFLDAQDPVALMVGGLAGQVEIAGQLVCVNPPICGVMQSGLLSSSASSPAQPMAATATYNHTCGQYVCGDTTVLSWNPAWTAGFQKIYVQTFDLRWGRIHAYPCGYWPGIPPRTKYCFRREVFPNTLAQQTIFYQLDECTWDRENPDIRMDPVQLDNTARVGKLYERGNWLNTACPPMPSGLTWHQFVNWNDPIWLSEQVPTSFNGYDEYTYPCAP